MKHVVNAIVVLLCISSCGRLQKTKNSSHATKKLTKKDSVALDIVRVQEAKLSIPVPMSAQPLMNYFDSEDSATMLGYKDETLSMADIQNFYKCEMESLGWELQEQFLGYESQLRFTKPDRSCLISIRIDEEKKNTRFVIATGSQPEVVC
jgi:hypothetical protein